MDLILAMWIAYYLVKNTTQDLVYKSTGKLPPSYLREQERRKRRAERQPITDRTEARKFFANAWHDAWADAAERRERGRQKRRERWAAEDGPPAAETAPDRPAGGPAPAESDVAGMDVADPIAPTTRPDEPPAPRRTGPPPDEPPPAATSRPAKSRGERTCPIPDEPPGPPAAPPAPGVVHDEPTYQATGEMPPPEVLDNEEVMYRRYALRRNNGVPTTPEQLAADLGLSPANAEILHQQLDARYVEEHPGAERIPTPDLAKAAERMACEGCGGKTHLEPTDDPAKWLMRTTHTDPACPHDSARVAEQAGQSPTPMSQEMAERHRELAAASARKRMVEAADAASTARAREDWDQEAAHLKEAEHAAAELGITSMHEMEQAIDAYKTGTPLQKWAPVPTQPGNATPQINGMENDMTATGETTGLASALAYTSAMATSAGDGAASVETSLASLQSGEVSGEALSQLAAAQEHLAAAQAAFNAAHATLSSHQNVAEAYAANADAGNKQFLLND